MSKSQEVYEAVEARIATGVNKQTAFEQVAATLNAKPSAVAGNYYRHAKKIGAPVQPRKRRARSGPKAKPAAPPEPANSDLPQDAPIAEAVAALQAERDAQAALIEEMRRLLFPGAGRAV